MRIPLFQIDAFTSQVLKGNPAAVCPLEEWLNDALLQAIAAENNLSETAFLVGGNGRYRLRWFTPALEIGLCGHATLAAAHVLYRELATEQGGIVFDTLSGPLAVEREGDRIVMDFPRHSALPCDGMAGLSAALGGEPAATLRAQYAVAVFGDEAQVRTLRPDMRLLQALDTQGVIATAPGLAADYVCRVFAPKLGIAEDPVTGSAHCLLAPYWATRLQKTAFTAHHLSARGGEVLCRLLADKVRLAGQAVTYLQGELRL